MELGHKDLLNSSSGSDIEISITYFILVLKQKFGKYGNKMVEIVDIIPH